MNIKKRYGDDADLIWKDKKRYLGMPLSFTRYYLVKKQGQWFKMFLDIGFLSSTVEELNLYRVCDITMKQSILDRICGTGTIILSGSDATNPDLVLKSVKNPYRVRDMLADYVEQERKINNIRLTDFHAHH